MTDEQLAEIEARANKASPAPWMRCTAHGGNCSCSSIWSIPLDAPVAECNSKWGEAGMEYGDIGEEAKQANKDFIAHAREDVPALIAEIRRLRGA